MGTDVQMLTAMKDSHGAPDTQVRGSTARFGDDGNHRAPHLVKRSESGDVLALTREGDGYTLQMGAKELLLLQIVMHQAQLDKEIISLSVHRERQGGG